MWAFLGMSRMRVDSGHICGETILGCLYDATSKGHPVATRNVKMS